MIKFLDIYNQDKKLHRTILTKIDKLFKKGDFNEAKRYYENISPN